MRPLFVVDTLTKLIYSSPKKSSTRTRNKMKAARRLKPKPAILVPPYWLFLVAFYAS
ncbi:hypothetical protein SAMN00808754_2764 [Thermanaeromonas toyohensis ToBE]|uniref:Uncharacterized protein n=1 Tax=Thermanaeromonas toyohensis ToBE TaxID=698762 RepID=A0A1W1W0J0_9FIRM|nr:hypothetical protein SAMN00808754_2764 [Thermanaeromonas toyohensis ToBE]